AKRNTTQKIVTTEATILKLPQLKDREEPVEIILPKAGEVEKIVRALPKSTRLAGSPSTKLALKTAESRIIPRNTKRPILRRASQYHAYKNLPANPRHQRPHRPWPSHQEECPLAQLFLIPVRLER